LLGIVTTGLLMFNREYLHWAAGSIGFWGELFVVGGIAAATLMGVYLYVTNTFSALNADSGFSSNRIEDYKNFMRFHINTQGELTIYPVGIPKIEQNWCLNKNGSPGDSWFVTESGRAPSSYAQLIETPFIIKPPLSHHGREQA